MLHQITLAGFICLSVMGIAGCGGSVEHEHSSYSSPETTAEHTRTRIHVTSNDRTNGSYRVADQPVHIHVHPGGADVCIEITDE
jgi:predicted component of type VI protein secretion system